MECTKLEWVENTEFHPCAIGEPVDIGGLSFRAYFSDGSSLEVPVTSKIFNDPNMQAEGTSRKITIKYDGQKLTGIIPLLPVSLIRIFTTEYELECEEGKPLDKSTLHVFAEFSDGTKKEIYNYKFFPFAPLTERDSEISIKYGRCTCSIKITIKPSHAPVEADTSLQGRDVKKELCGIYVKDQKDKAYFVGDIAEADDFQVFGIFSDGTQERVTVQISPDTPLSVNTSFLSLRYENKTIIVPVKVKEKNGTTETQDNVGSYDTEGMNEDRGVMEEETPVIDWGAPDDYSTGKETSIEGNYSVAEPDPTEGKEVTDNKSVPAFYPSSFSIRFDN